MQCGARLKEEPEPASDQDGGFDLKSRVLCPDGTCTGIIIKGKCTECGEAYKQSGKKGDEGGTE